MTAAPLIPAFEDLVPRQDPTARLLLLLAKTDLNESQVQEARFLAGQIQSWNEFAHVAAIKFIVTYAHRHLQACATDLAPLSALDHMRDVARASTMSTL